MSEQINCVHCGATGALLVIDDVFYAQSSNNKCVKWNKYQFVGISAKSAIAQWNEANVPSDIHTPAVCRKYSYKVDGDPVESVERVAAKVKVGPSYIRDAFCKAGVKYGTITIRGHQITREAA